MTYSEKIRVKQSSKRNKNILVGVIIGILLCTFMISYYQYLPSDYISSSSFNNRILRY